MNLSNTLTLNCIQATSVQGGARMKKKDPGSIFFLRSLRAGLTN